MIDLEREPADEINVAPIPKPAGVEHEPLDPQYARKEHNHKLADLSERSYNSLTDKPTLISLSNPLRIVSQDYTTTANDYITIQTGSGKNVIVGAASCILGRVIKIKNATGGSMIISSENGKTFDGETTLTFLNKDSFSLAYDGNNWVVI